MADEHLTASHTYDSSLSHGPDRSRLNEVREANVGIAGWASGTNEAGTWIEADLRALTFVYKIATQGRGDSTLEQWVESYKIAHANEADAFEFIANVTSGNDAIFNANSDQETIVYNSFEAVLCRFIRLYPETFNTGIVLRWEVYGCPYGGVCTVPSIEHTSMVGAVIEFIVFDEVYLFADPGFIRSNGYERVSLQCMGSGYWDPDLNDVVYNRKYFHTEILKFYFSVKFTFNILFIKYLKDIWNTVQLPTLFVSTILIRPFLATT